VSGVKIDGKYNGHKTSMRNLKKGHWVQATSPGIRNNIGEGGGKRGNPGEEITWNVEGGEGKTLKRGKQTKTMVGTSTGQGGGREAKEQRVKIGAQRHADSGYLNAWVPVWGPSKKKGTGKEEKKRKGGYV